MLGFHQFYSGSVIAPSVVFRHCVCLHNAVVFYESAPEYIVLFPVLLGVPESMLCVSGISPSDCVPAVFNTSISCVPAVLLPQSFLFRQCSTSTSTLGAVFHHQLCSGSVLPPSVLFRQCFSSICCVPAVFYLNNFGSGSVISPLVVFRQCFCSICCIPAVLYKSSFRTLYSWGSVLPQLFLLRIRNRIMALFYIYQFYSGSVIAPSCSIPAVLYHPPLLLGQCFTSIISVPAVFYLNQFYSAISSIPAVFFLHLLCSGSVIHPSVLFRQGFSSICCVPAIYFCSGSVISPSVLFRQCYFSTSPCYIVCVPAVFYLNNFCSGSVITSLVVFQQCYCSISCIPAVLYLHQYCWGSVLPQSFLFRQCFTSISSIPAVFFLHLLCSGSVLL